MLRDDLSSIVPVILAGGLGRRLWPLSRPSKPKPFLKIMGRKSFLQKTAARVCALKPPFIVCNKRHRALVMEQTPDAAQIILEPVGRGTAPAIAAVAHYLANKGGDELLLVLPSDHAIKDPELLLEAVIKGVRAAKEGWLVTFGVRPRSPSTHYGYIRGGAVLNDEVFAAESFVEKPDKKTAQGYIRQGDYYWNSGIFLLSVKTYLENLKAQQEEIFEASYDAVARASRLQNSIFLNENAFSACPALSIDYAVMENAPKCAVVPVSMGWRDLGTWGSLLASILKK